MTKTPMFRAAHVADFTGRTLEGIATKYDRPSRVTDDGWRSSYWEEITRGADNKTLADRVEFPFRRYHDASIQLGTVTFHRSDAEDALLFRALIDHGPIGDEFLEEIEEWRDVSLGFRSYRDAHRSTPYHGRITQRREIRIIELSAAPTGTGLAKGAETLTVRASEPFRRPRLEASRRRLMLLDL